MNDGFDILPTFSPKTISFSVTVDRSADTILVHGDEYVGLKSIEKQ